MSATARPHPLATAPRPCMAPWQPAVLPLLAALLCVLLAGCSMLEPPAPRQTGQASLPAEPAARPTAQDSTADLLRRGDEAWNSSAYAQCLNLYFAALARPDMRPESRPMAYERAASSALEVDHPAQALDLLRRWAAVEPTARSDWSWHTLYVRGLTSMGMQGLARDHLAGVLADRQVNYGLRSKAAVSLAQMEIERDRAGDAVKVLRAIHAKAPGDQARADLERDLLDALRTLPDNRLLPLAAAAADGFPRPVFRLAAAERLAKNTGYRSQEARTMAGEIVAQNQLADMTPAKALLAQTETLGSGPAPSADTSPAPADNQPAVQPEQQPGQQAAEPSAHPDLALSIPVPPQPASGVALAIPLTGRLGDVGQKILAGATLAQRQMAAQGRGLNIQTVDTAEPGWQDKIRALPSDIQLVGGPLLLDDLREAVSSGLTQNLHFFAFLQTLGPVREGQDAWRFFSSLRDQVRAMLHLAVNDLGIRDVSVLAPTDPYGQKMSEVFDAEAQSAGATVAATGTYGAGSSAGLSQKVRALLQTAGDSGPRAVFLPDSWAKVQELAPYFSFHDAEDMLLMGPELWSQAMAKPQYMEEGYFSLAVCPGAYYAANPAIAARALRESLSQSGQEPDLWTALGYDFVHFAAALGAVDADPAALNARLASLSGLQFSLAPITWDSQGRASQQLFVFKPNKEGLQLVDPQAMLDQLQRTRAHREERLRMKAQKADK